MNLLQDQWITIQRKNGGIEKIAPYQITDGVKSDNPIVDIVTPRPDFKGALYQFLIGLIQTIYPPKDDTEWDDRFTDPPSPEELKKATDKIDFAFDLFGEEVRFMQDISIIDESSATDISSLFIDSPGENTVKENKDHFVKRNTINCLCPNCAAVGLFTLQTNSPSGGQGHLTSIRGGGPLTTILKYDTKRIEDLIYKTLWSDIYMNVMPKQYFHDKDKKLDQHLYIFPWITGNFIKRDKNGSKATTKDLHPLAVYWSYPRRIYLHRTQGDKPCDICQEHSKDTIESFSMKPYGLDYGGGGWVHPLSPYYFKKDKELGDTWFPYHPQPGGIIYNNWLAFIYGKTNESRNAQVINYFHEKGRKEGQTQVYAFGYDMDNMKARCWYESSIPLYRIEPSYIDTFESAVTSLLQASTQVANNLQNTVKNAWFSEGSKPKGSLDYIKISFFKATENQFFTNVKAIRDNIDADSPLDDYTKWEWVKYLNEESLKIFDLYVESGSIEFENIKRIVNARTSLISWNLGKKMKSGIGLTSGEKPIAKKRATTKKGAKKR